jgi:hypothetical protein
MAFNVPNSLDFSLAAFTKFYINSKVSSLPTQFQGKCCIINEEGEMFKLHLEDETEIVVSDGKSPQRIKTTIYY